MAEEKKDNKKEESCPFCKVSEETIKRLKEKGLERKEKEEKEKQSQQHEI